MAIPSSEIVPKIEIDPRSSQRWDITVATKEYIEFLRQKGINEDSINKISLSFLYEEDTRKKNYGYYESFKKNIALYLKDIENDNPGKLSLDELLNEGFLHETAHFIEDESGKGDNISRSLMRTATLFVTAGYASTGVAGTGALQYGYSKLRSQSPETGVKLLAAGVGGAALTALAWKVRTSSFYHDYIDRSEQFAFRFADDHLADHKFLTITDK